MEQPSGAPVEKQALLIRSYSFLDTLKSIFYFAEDVFSGNFSSMRGIYVGLWRETSDLRKTLAANGYAVTYVKQLHEGKIDQVIGSMASAAGANTTTLVMNIGHSSMYSGTSYVPMKGKTGFFNHCAMSDSTFLLKVASIPGGIVVAVAGCKAGGFPDAAANLADSDKERMVVVSASDRGNICSLSPLRVIVRHAIGGKEPFISEFDRMNGHMHPGWKKSSNFAPKAFCVGKKAAAIRL